MKLTKLIPVLSLLAALIALALVATVRAEGGPTFTVNSTLDEPDANLNTPECSSAPSNKCTLRAAIMQANANEGKDTIFLPTGQYGLGLNVQDEDLAAGGDLDIYDELVIQGNGPNIFIDGQYKDRIFDLHTGAHLYLSGLKLGHGNVSTTPYKSDGGGIRMRGAIAEITNVVFDNSYAHGVGGALYVGEYSNAYLKDVTMQYNEAIAGGAIFNHGGLILSNSTLHTNTAKVNGGALVNVSNAHLVNVTMSENHAGHDGGAVSNNGLGDGSTELDLSNVTIAGNIADYDEDGAGEGGGVSNLLGEIVHVRNSIIALNTSANPADPGAPDDCKGAFLSDGYNLIGNIWNCGGFSAGKGDQFENGLNSLDPLITPLLGNGGVTKTRALIPGSPAIDKGAYSPGCKDSFGISITTDQRGFARPADGGSGVVRCDIGAYEFKSPGTPTPTATATQTPTQVPTAIPTEPACSSKPTAPTLSKPADNAQVVKAKVKLNWNDVDCAEKYKILVKRDTKKGPKAFKKTVTESKVKTKALEKGHTYFWRAKACSTAGCTKSPWFSFVVNP